jgi:hypothetical protein
LAAAARADEPFATIAMTPSATTTSGGAGISFGDPFDPSADTSAVLRPRSQSRRHSSRATRHRARDPSVAIPIAPVVAKPAIAFVANHSCAFVGGALLCRLSRRRGGGPPQREILGRWIRIIRGVLVVLDTNAFHSDVHGTQPRLSGILDGPVSQAAFEVFVPEVVMLELDKQFAQRSKKLVREINKAVGAHRGELAALGMAAPEGMTVDEDAVNDYREHLEKRLAKAGAKILPVPDDLAAALDWAVHRRKPFNSALLGFIRRNGRG